MAMQRGTDGKIDRQTTTPFLLKLFYRNNGFQSLSDIAPSDSAPLPPHLQIYTWPTCTLRELSHLLVSAIPSTLPSPAIGTRLAYRLVYPDTHTSPHAGGPGRYLSKEFGSVIVGGEAGLLPGEEEEKVVTGGVMAGRLEGEPDKSLLDMRFVIGDFVSCAVFPPGADGAVAPAPGRGRAGGDFGRGGAFGAPREGNGYGGVRGRGPPRGGGMFNGGGRLGEGRLGDGGVPSGEWRRGERVPDGPGGRGGYGRGRGRAW